MRRCIATMESRPPEGMIRFVLSPDAVVTPDLAGRLPGRGAWLGADADSLRLALKKGAFARAFKAQAKASPDLVAEVEALLERRLLDGLGLLRRGDNIVSGYDQVREWIRANRPACVIEASDGAEDGRQGVLGLLKAAHGGDSGTGAPPVVGCFSGERLGMALGRARVIHACLKHGRAAQAWMEELARLSGFRPLAPADWATSQPVSRLSATDDPATGGRRNDAGH